MRYRMKQKVGKHHMKDANGQRIIVKPGDVIESRPQDIGASMYKFEQLDAEPELVIRTMRTEPDGKGKFHVINVNSQERINDVPLTAEQAAEMVGQPLATMFEKDAELDKE